MHCHRCEGLRVPELMVDGGMRLIAYRCVHCGDLVDEKILRHRIGKVTPPRGRARTPIFGKDRAPRHRPTVVATYGQEDAC